MFLASVILTRKEIRKRELQSFYRRMRLKPMRFLDWGYTVGVLNGSKHLEATSELGSLNVSRICQEHFDTGNIQHFFYDRDLFQLKKCG